MKKELKKLYKKDKALALEVAKVLGFTIKVKAEEMDFKDLPKQTQDTLKRIGWAGNINSILKDSLFGVKITSNKRGFLRKEILKYLMKDPNFDVAVATGNRVMTLRFLYAEEEE